MYLSNSTIAAALLMSVASASNVAAPPLVELPAPLRVALQRRSVIDNTRYELSTIMPTFTSTVRVDPARRAGERVTVVTPPPAERARQFAQHRDEFDKAAATLLWCDHRLAELLPSNAQLAAETLDSVTYLFQPQAGADASAQERKLLTYVRARVTLSKPDATILSLKVQASQPFSPEWLVHVDSYELTLRCIPMPDHRSRVQTLRQQMQGSAFGRRFNDRFEQRFSPLGPDTH